MAGGNRSTTSKSGGQKEWRLADLYPLDKFRNYMDIVCGEMEPERVEALHDNIRESGEIESPIHHWNGAIVDGYHRYDYFMSLPPGTIPPPDLREHWFEDDAEAYRWMINHHLGKRPVDLHRLRNFDANQFGVAEAARIHHTSESAIRRSIQLITGEEAVEKVAPELKGKVRKKVPKKDLQKVGSYGSAKDRKKHASSVAEEIRQNAIRDKEKRKKREEELEKDRPELKVTAWRQVYQTFQKKLVVLTQSVDRLRSHDETSDYAEELKLALVRLDEVANLWNKDVLTRYEHFRGETVDDRSVSDG